MTVERSRFVINDITSPSRVCVRLAVSPYASVAGVPRDNVFRTEIALVTLLIITALAKATCYCLYVGAETKLVIV